MAAVGNPRTWIPYMNSKDCSQGFCSLYCPQWCYIVYPPPPPFEYPDDDSSPNFSPLVIAIIGILATAFLLVSYCTLISKYCGPRESARRDPNDDDLQDNHNHNHNSSNSSLHEHASVTGLDEALIKSIAVFKYKKGVGGSAGVTDCAVCLSEFQDGESVRLLPKCSHVFHVPCIDTWLKSHSTCPLCRAGIFTPEVEAPSSRNETSSENESVVGIGSGNNEFQVVEEEEESIHHSRAYPKPALRAFSDLSSFQGRHRVIEIRDEVCESGVVGRSVSMDRSFQSGLSVADVLQMNDEEEDYSQVEEGCSSTEEAGPSKRSSRGASSKYSSYKTRVLHCVLSPIAMKRSFSSGRFSVSKSGRARHAIPI